MLNLKISTETRKLIAFDIILFAILLKLLASYKLFFMLLTAGLCGYFVYQLISFLFFLSRLDLDYSSSTKTTTSDKIKLTDELLFQLKLKKFLFKNENVYRLIKNVLLKKNYIREQFEKVFNATHDESATVAETAGEEQPLNETLNIDQELDLFFQKFSQHLIQTWYTPYISENGQFLVEVNSQLVLILRDLIARFDRVNKLQFLSDIAFIFNKSFLSVFIEAKGEAAIDLNLLHPAMRNGPASEIVYLKRFVQIVLRKSAHPKLHLKNNAFLDEFFMQIIGRNVLETSVDLLARPNFLFYALAYSVNKRKTNEKFAAKLQDETDSTASAKFSLNDEFSDSNELLDMSRSSDVILNNAQETLDERGLKFESEEKLKILSTELKNLDEEMAQEDSKLHNEFETNNRNRSSNLLSFQVVNVFICKTETNIEKSSGKEFTSYHIHVKYKPSFMSVSTPTLAVDELSNAAVQFKTVKRRYREFVQLQRTLEDNASLRMHLKNVSGPAKYNIPFGRMYTENVEKRRLKLNEYLTKLTRIPKICASREFISFLDLEESKDSFLSIDRSSSENNALFRTFSGVFEKINPVYRKTEDLADTLYIEQQIDKIDYDYSQNESFERMAFRLETILAELKHETDKLSLPQSLKNVKKKKNYRPEVKEEAQFIMNVFEVLKSLLSHTSSSMSSMATKNFDTINLAETICNNYYTERYFQDFFETLLTTENIASYLRLIEGLLFTKSPTAHDFNSDTKIYYELAFQVIIERIPNFLKLLIGEKQILASIELALNSLKIKILNRHIIYCLFDLILFNLYPEEFETNIQNYC